MKKGHQYKLNPFLLSFYNSEVDAEFNKNFFKQDLYALRLVIGLGAILSLVFVFIDMWRYENNKLVSAIFRSVIALILLIFGASTFFFKDKHYALTQLIAMAVSFFVAGVFFMHYHFNEDPAFDIFLSNILMVLIFIISTIMGFRFRYAILINTFFFATYIIYIQLFNYSTIASRQISQLAVIYSVGFLAAYLLERQKINLFLSKKELHAEIQKVDNLNNIKNKLFSIISHDVRGPIVSLKGIVSLFNKEALTHEEFKTLSKDLEKDLQNTSILMDNLLAWSKSQMEGIALKKVKIDIWREIKSLEELYRNQLISKAILLKVKPESNILINGDREMIQIILRNLFSNAIKFTPHGGEISISGKPMDRNYMIIIKDSGPGIEPDKLQSLFEINKNNVVGTSSASGAGIGLMLVKEFIDANDGQIKCESSVGKGTVFKVFLPMI
ncbi:hypothetical protein GCM10011506_33830 [Marivirga lumbricoides]|uniref:histidine kinase n=1 Tax=Marivirga lumbricoides TaxID=1046115 RepID=A0A2T4DLB6_9BACT|nr:hypothetical protein C9994_11995 [Marivirga lumbricoides]GGC45455.1 hypothetical protein GCM10011506_33830 [Marivirga lumbricoides]